MTLTTTLVASPDPDPESRKLFASLAASTHPLWCHNRDEIGGCRDADEEYQILHTRDTVDIPMRDLNEQPVKLGVSLFRAIRNHGPLETGVEIHLPGGHADLNRDQVRLLIAELSHLDNLWEF